MKSDLVLTIWNRIDTDGTPSMANAKMNEN